jgi:hypothetical protein
MLTFYRGKFICTQTDDCEATEIMRDHQDVAMQEPGRWETMTAVRDELAGIEKRQSHLAQGRADLDLLCKQALKELKHAKAELRKAQRKKRVDPEAMKDLQTVLSEKSKENSVALKRLHWWDRKKKEKIVDMKEKIRIRQRRLKALCAIVRNEYSKACLQADFRAGLQELCRTDDADGAPENNTPEIPLPNDFEMDVFCISANDYLKISGIKPFSDGLANTFSDARDTQIPALRTNVHVTSAHQRTKFTETFVCSVGDMVDRVKLLASGASNVPGSRTAHQCKSIFGKEMEKLAKNVKSAAENFCQRAREKVKLSLHPSLTIGAEQGRLNAMSVVESWGSTSRRNRWSRSPDQNGLYHGTYFATIRRDGCYISPAAGPVDFNQELCDLMEKEFSTSWQQTMDAAFQSFLDELENKVAALCVEVDKALVSEFRRTGTDLGRLQEIANIASRTCGTFVKSEFEMLRRHSTEAQRIVSRSLLPMLQERMKDGYREAMCVPKGTGSFLRMKAAVVGHSRDAVLSMFDESTIQLLKAIDKLVTTMGEMTEAVSTRITSALSGVYSVCWEDHTSRTPVDPAMLAKIRACRAKLLPDLNRLFEWQKSAMDLVGIDRVDLELDMMAVASLQTCIEERFKQAERNGEVIDLRDSVDDMKILESTTSRQPRSALASAGAARFKADPG